MSMKKDDESSVVVEEKKKVKEVCREFMLKSDELLANKLQVQECFEHYKINQQLAQKTRENIAKSKPVVEMYQNSEYEEFLRNRQIEDQDALMAIKIQNQLLKEFQAEQIFQQQKDQEFARLLQQKEILNENKDPKKETFIEEESSDTYLFEDNGSNISKELLGQLNNLNIKKSASNSSNDQSVSRVLNNETTSTNSNDSSYLMSNNNANSQIYDSKDDIDSSLAKYLQQEEDNRIRLQDEIRKRNDERLAKLLQEQENNQFNKTNNLRKNSISNISNENMMQAKPIAIENPYVLEELPDVDIMKNNAQIYRNPSNYNNQIYDKFIKNSSKNDRIIKEKEVFKLKSSDRGSLTSSNSSSFSQKSIENSINDNIKQIELESNKNIEMNNTSNSTISNQQHMVISFDDRDNQQFENDCLINNFSESSSSCELDTFEREEFKSNHSSLKKQLDHLDYNVNKVKKDLIINTPSDHKYKNILDNLKKPKCKMASDNQKNIDYKNRTVIANNYENTNDKETFLPVNNGNPRDNLDVPNMMIIKKKKKFNTQCLHQ